MDNSGFIDSFYFFQEQLISVTAINPIESIELSGYEVIKLVSGKPLFYEDHLYRLNQTLLLSGFGNYSVSAESFSQKVNLLCDANNKYFGNLEVRVSKTVSGLILFFLGFIPHKYPNPTDYLNGIPTEILFIERDNPNAKIKSTEARKKSDLLIKETSVGEILLVNHLGLLTEGSRSNLFLIKNKTIYTASDSEVLKGITRKYIIEIIRKLGINLVNTGVEVNHLHEIEAAFICGTSPGVLPIQRIREHILNPHHPIIKQVIFEFNQVVQDYLSSHT